jgi:hypothetical protein
MHTGHQFRNGPEIGSVAKVATLAQRCLDLRGAHMVWDVAKQDVQISGELIAPARTIRSAQWSIPPVTLRNNWRPYHETGENPRIIIIIHNRPPVGSRILRLAIGDLARDAKQRETLQI